LIPIVGKEGKSLASLKSQTTSRSCSTLQMENKKEVYLLIGLFFLMPVNKERRLLKTMPRFLAKDLYIMGSLFLKKKICSKILYGILA
jgi:hypothetical protein